MIFVNVVVKRGDDIYIIMLSPWTLNSWSSRPHSCPPFGSSRRSPAGERCSLTEMFKVKVRALLRAISDCTRPPSQSPNRCKHPRVWWNLTLYVIFPGRCISTNLLLFSNFIGDNTKPKLQILCFLSIISVPKELTWSPQQEYTPLHPG